MSIHLKIFATIVTVILLSACGEEAEKKPEPAVASEGEMIFKKNCKVCHAQGINGAPIIGNTAMWSDRVTKGIPTLVEHATQGFGLMPAKGGNTELPDTDVEKAVKFMVSQVQ